VSNAQKKTSGSFSLSDYKAKAKKIADEAGPFVLVVDTDNSITIPRPDGNTLIAIESAATSADIITLLCGEHADAVLELFGPEDHTALKALGTDIQKHFGIGQ
jgi:hypothetical protein